MVSLNEMGDCPTTSSKEPLVQEHLAVIQEGPSVIRTYVKGIKLKQLVFYEEKLIYETFCFSCITLVNLC